MSELNLIPYEYRKQIRIRIWLKYFVVFYVLLIISLFAGKYFYANKLYAIEQEVTDLENTERIAANEQQKLNDLEDTQKVLENRVKILRDLRGGEQALDMFSVMDRALDMGTWFKNWIFIRAGEIQLVDSKTVNTGYLIIIEKDDTSNLQKTWRLNTHMEIEGEALDHTYLAGFVSRLVSQPEIDEVKVIKTSLRLYPGKDVVSFSLLVKVNNQDHG